ncbi:TonB-dependent receptor [Acidicapsa acidisoli]|uniref:TonB-dependent receptor n=1 Tax=Acidicapsa acidisoli TaxID=1615681 RepID=UPI0021E0AA5D|nr:TonB-dependent receptor [Acidicapsa acidisoli]
MRIRTFGFAIYLSFLVTGLLHAQQTASISGRLYDSTHAALDAAQVTLRNTSSNATRDTVTDAQGLFTFALLPAGNYELQAGKEGFQTSILSNIQLTVGQSALQDLTLHPGNVSQQVEVQEDTPLEGAAMNSSSGLVTGEEIRNLPLNGRSFDQLILLNPGTVNFTSQRTGGIGTSNSVVGNQFAISGRRPQENLFLLDGVEYTGASGLNQTPGGTSGLLLGVDALREFNLLTDTYGAAYGKRPGGQVLMVANSGTNELHGAAYDFLRNSAMDARNYFDQATIPEFQRSQFGGELGGPLRHNRSFLFGNYEGFRENMSLSDVTLVPDNNARNGYLPGTDGGLKYVGVAPATVPYLALWPLANGPDLGGGIAEAFSHPVQTIHEDFGTARLDQYLTRNDSLSATYLVDDSGDNTPTQNPYSQDFETTREQVVSGRETHIFSPRLVNLATLGYSRAHYFFTSDTTADVPPFIAGRGVGVVVVGGSATPNTSSSITSAGTNTGDNHYSIRNLFTEADSIAYTTGRHSITAGVWFERVQFNDDLALSQYGQASFSSLLDFLEGTISTFTAVPSPTDMDWRSLESAAFAQDQIRLTSRLSLSLGFRYEGTNGWNEANGRASTFLLGPNGALETQPRISSSAFTINRAKFLPQPRVGFAWDAFGNGRTTVHGGFGMYNDLQDALGYRTDQNAPFNTTITLKNIALSSLPIVPGQPVNGGLVAPNGVQQDMYTPTVLSYTLKVEQAISPTTTLTIGYVGSHGYHETSSADLNQALPTFCPNPACPANLPAGTIYYPAGSPLANPQLGSGWTWISQADNLYNALQVDFRKRMSHGLDLRGAYTWARSMDDGDTLNASGAANTEGLAEDAHNLRLDWGRSNFDVRNAATINAVYSLPYGRNPANCGTRCLFLGGWNVAGIFNYQGGLPFTPELSFNPSNNGDTTNPVRPSLNPNFHENIITGNPSQYFVPTAFVVPQAGTYGNVQRDSLTGPAVTELDTSLYKTVHLAERLNFQLRGDAFNILNHANFNTPNLVIYSSATSAPSASAGVITSTSTTSRQLQVSARLTW